MATPSVEFELEGMDELVSRLEAWGADAVERADVAVEQAAKGAVQQAQGGVRVDTGRLRRTIESHRITWGHHRVSAGDGLGYASRIERLDAYFNPAVKDARDDLRRRIKAAIP